MSGPDTHHANYDAHCPMWEKCRDVVAGEDAVHKKGEAYLPRLSEQTGPEYQAYVQRAPFYNATARTIDGLVGMVLRKEPTVEVPAAMDALRADMTLTGMTLTELAEQILREVVTVGREGLLIEYPLQIEGPLTQAQASALNRRPYASVFHAEHIINWRVERVNNAMQPVMVVLAETVTEWSSAFESDDVEQRRALLLEDGRYVQRIYRKAETSGEWVQFGSDIVPLMNNAPLSYVPFVVFGPMHNSLMCQKPPVYDLVTLNLSHYRTIADYEHGAHFTGLPMLFLAGVQLADGEKVKLGSQTAVVSIDPASDGKYIEFTGQGLGTLKDRAAEKEAGMAAIGARMLAPEKAGVEAQGTMSLRHSGESAVLSTIAKMVGAGMTRVLQIMAEWEGIDAEVSVTLNTDFVDLSMTPQEVTALVDAWMKGAISRQTLFENLKRGEIVSMERTFEEEEAAIDNTAPMLAPGQEEEPPIDTDPQMQPQAPAEAPVVDTQPIADAMRAGLDSMTAAIAAMPQAPQITVSPPDMASIAAAIGALQPPTVTVNSPPISVRVDKGGAVTFTEDDQGRITGATLN